MSLIFSMDWGRFAKRNAAPVHRKPKYLALLGIGLHGVKQVHESFLNYIALKRIELSYTGQTMQLERYLNDQFDVSQRRIRIIHQDESATTVFLYLESEGQTPVWVYFESEAATPPYLYFEGNGGSALTADFIVKIPTDLTGKTEQIRGAVKRYKVGGPTYDVTT